MTIETNCLYEKIGTKKMELSASITMSVVKVRETNSLSKVLKNLELHTYMIVKITMIDA